MKIKYKSYKLREDALSIIDKAREILEEYDKQGYTLSLRQLYYQFVSRDILPNNQKSYNRLGDIVGKGREMGLLDWDHLEDRGRAAKSLTHWNSPSELIEAVVNAYTIDLWEGQPKRVEVWLEKDALAEIVGNAARPFDVTYFANKGYCSMSAIWDAGHNRFLNYYKRGLDVLVLHLGDHDPSGIDMSRDIEERLRLFSRISQYPKRELIVERIALNMDQVNEYEPPPNPAKVTDSRAMSYIATFGTESWELDALEPTVITTLIQTRIRANLIMSRFQRRQELQASKREELKLIAENYEEIIETYK